MKTYTIYLRSGNKLEHIGEPTIASLRKDFVDKKTISFWSKKEMIRLDFIEAIIKESNE